MTQPQLDFTHSYRNPWANSTNVKGPEFYTTSVRPVEYRGYALYARMSNCVDVVKDGVCISQMAAMGGAKTAVDNLLATGNIFGIADPNNERDDHGRPVNHNAS